MKTISTKITAPLITLKHKVRRYENNFWGIIKHESERGSWENSEGDAINLVRKVCITIDLARARPFAFTLRRPVVRPRILSMLVTLVLGKY